LEREFVEGRVPKWKAHWDEYGYGGCVIRLKATGEPVGAFAVFHTDFPGDTVLEIGWMVDPKHQRNGYAHEAARGFVDYARAYLNEKAITAFPGYDNPPSNRICEKLGMKLVDRRPYPFGAVTLQSNYWRLNLKD
jgi:RimJ/RimL family protein N-acetyltransferase